VLIEAGADLLLIETMNNIPEMRSAIRAAQRLDAEFWISVNPADAEPRNLLSGERVDEALRVAEGEGASAFLANCAAIQTIETAVSDLAQRASIRIGGYANNGVPDPVVGWRFDQTLSETDFAQHAARLVELGASIVGGCCGTTPSHLHAAAKALGRG
jgi:5-methyltetrahydrofolate--homocysteine methyltransferase